MALQLIKNPSGQSPKGPSSDQPKKGVKNPWIYAGTIVLLVIVVVAFVFVPAGGGALSGSQNNLEFGRYAGKSVTYAQNTYFATQVKDLNDSLRQSGLSADNYQFYAYQVWRGAFERSVVRIAILDAMSKAGAIVTETRIDQKVTELPNYQENGKFSLQRYRQATLSDKLTLRNNIRDDLLTQLYYEDAVVGLPPSSKEIDFVKAMAKDTRSIEYVAFPLSSFPDAEVASWAKANAASLRRLELSSITVSTSESDALKLRKSIEEKKSAFADVAKASSKDSYANKGGSQGQRYFYEIESEFAKKEDAEKIAALAKDALSPVLKTVSGSWVFYRADSAAQAADLSNPTVLSDARTRMLASDRGKIEDYVIAKAKDFAAEAATNFDKAAKGAGLSPKAAGPFPLNYGDLSLYIAQYRQSMPLLKAVSGNDTPELAAASTSDKFLTSAFSVAPGSLSEPIVLGENVVVFKVKEAATADDSASGIEFLYPYFVNSKSDTEARQAFLKSPLLKDNFSAVYLKYFMPKEKATK